MPVKRSPITIIGAGISGLTLGRILLQNHGIQAKIFEKARNSANRNNYGITLYSDAYRPLLKALNLDEDGFKKKVAVDSGIGGSGRLMMTGGDDDDDYASSFRANRRRLEGLLAEGLDVKWESEIEEIIVRSGQEEDDVVVRVAGGEDEYSSQIVVGADGPHSKVRQKVVDPNMEFNILPFATYNGKRAVKHEEWEAKGINALLESKVLEQRIGSALLQVSLNDCSKEGMSVSYTYSRVGETTGQDELFRPERPKNAAREMPEALFAEISSIRDQLEQPFKSVFDPEAMRKDRLLNWLMRTAKVGLDRLHQAADRGVILLGDSVHPEPILGGLGANEAIEDVVQLASLLAKGGRESLKQYYADRYSTWERGLAESLVRINEMHSRPRSSL